MIHSLPRWLELGAFTLALLAGIVNAVGLLGFAHQSVSHLSGTATLLGAGLLSDTGAWHLLAILLSFLLGAAISGYLNRSETLSLGRHYDTLLVIEGALLLIAIAFLQREQGAGHYFASAACGLQNAMATRYSGAVVRTTHVTGLFTDLGIMIGAALRGEHFDRRKAILFMLIILGFTGGGSVGAWLYAGLGFFALTIPAVLCFLLALAYRITRLRAASTPIGTEATRDE
ncbi:MAG: YoaK family protein [Spongiibacter marinus]|uniref:YoaK family protein n=1 Tax=Spongiibacter marinus TaxID=354246 RepID=UPI003C3CA336